MKVFISNRWEKLAEVLKEELFQSGQHPFAKRWVIVPNERIKQDLFLRWAHGPIFQIAAGFKMITWCEALGRLFPGIPSQMELSLKIEMALDRTVEEPLLSYLGHGGQQRKASLCDKIGGLFLQYLNQPEEKLLKWLRQSGWQQSLWREVFTAELPWKEQKFFEGAVYLFHPSHLAPYQLQAFKEMEAACFLFSPCEMYWADLRTFRQQQFLLKKSEGELSHYFENDHPLLANWGRKGRELLGLFENEEWTEVYEQPEADSLLTNVQGEILTLTDGVKQPDPSIQIHSASSKLREAEVVWEIIQRLPFEPREILVLAPDMQSYAAALELVFCERGGPYDFAIFGLEARSKSPLMQGLQDLLDLPRYRFSKEAVEKLLFCPPFLKRFGFEAEEVRLLQDWIGRTAVRYDLKGDHPSTWEAGLRRWVESLALTAREDRLSLDFSKSDLVSRFIGIIQLFEQELKVVHERLSLKEWSKAVRSLTEKFFAVSPDDDLMRELERLQQMQVEGIFPFSSVERLLKNIFQQNKAAVQASHLQAVRFASLEKGALIPAQAVILMGMEEGSFPRQDSPSSLQQLPLSSRFEEDRYLFLEALCSAREMFMMTYTRLHPEDGKSQKPCSMVEELSRYCGTLVIIDHPFSAFDPFYFQGEGFQSFSPRHFQILNQPEKYAEKVPHLSEMLLSRIDTTLLRRAARHPLQFFFEERVGLDFEWEEKDTEFVLSPLEMARLRTKSLKRPLEELLQELQREGKLPVGSFAKAAIQKIEEEINSYHQALAQLQVCSDEIYSIEFKINCTKPIQQDDRSWVYPALQLKQPSREIILQGKIEGLSSQGLLYHGDESLSDLLKIWPLYLTVKNIFPSLPLLLTKKGKASSLQVENPSEALLRYILYAEKALTTPSPLLPKWASGFFREGKISETDDDEIVQWAKARHLLPPAAPWVESWSPYLQEVFRELL